MNIPAEVKKMLESEKRCFLATSYLNRPHLSLMFFTFLANESLLILSSRSDTTKVKNIKNNSEVALLLYNSGHALKDPLSCTLYGTATVLANDNDDFYREAHFKRHSNMGTFILGDNISIITITIKNMVLADIKDQVQTWTAE